VLSTSFQFALALRLSNLVDPTKVLSFLQLPPSAAFDPSLAFLAAGALPLALVLYRRTLGRVRPRLGENWGVPGDAKIDMWLLLGSALFGVGWGIEGICPGPGLVNLGRAIAGGEGIPMLVTWIGGVVAGGLVAPRPYSTSNQ
jgi:uncharacterized membrane protein YedE/YeeE